MKYLVLIFFISFVQSALACTIETYSHILILNKNESYTNIIKKSDCTKDILGQFATFASAAQGTISSDSFQRSFPGITLKPDRVRFSSLEEYLEQRAFLPKEGRLINVSKLNGSGVIVIAEGQRFDVSCDTCPSTGVNTLKLVMRDNLGQQLNTHWLKVEIAIPAKAFVAKRHFPASFDGLDPTGFEIKTILTSKPQSLASTNAPIQFFKLSRSLAPGAVLERDNISPVQLVRPGSEVSVIISDGNVLINGSAAPLSYGVWGESIKLKNIRSSRIITGKVVDYNKVIVEL